MEMHLKDLFARFQEQFGSGPGLGPSSGTCLLNVEGIAPAFIISLFRASAALYRTDPWKRLRPGHLFGIRIGKDADWSNKKQLFPCAQFIGGDGGDLGFHLFKSEQDAQKMTGVRETIRVPNVELLRVIFQPESLLFPSNKRMVRSLSLEASGPGRFPVVDVARCTSTGGLRFRNPTLEELRYVFAFTKAVALVHPLLEWANDGAARRGRLMSFEPFIETVDVQWPPEVAKVGDLVAVTISHPPGQVYVEKKLVSTPPKYAEPPPKEELPPVEASANWTALRKCAMCEKEVHGDQSLFCGRCRAVVYCGPVCQKQHWKETHKSICGLYQAMMEREEELALKIFIFPCFVDHPCKWLESMGLHQKGMWRRKCSCYSHCPFGLLPLKASGIFESWGGLSDGEYPPDSAFPNCLNGASNPILLSGWSEYYSLRALPMTSPVAAILSHPLTVYHILTALVMSSKNRLIKGKEVIVHYLGPAGELDWMPAFLEITHLLNGSGNMQIVMIGPEVPSNLSGTVSGISGRLRVNLVRGIYQEQASYLSSPHAVIALNCGLESYGSWGGALELIKSMNVPAFFTERSEISCANAKQVLRGAGLHVAHPVTPNPFRSPLQDQIPSSNVPSFSNGFVFGVNT
ncbi:zinc finger MYND domain-containing protein 15 [Phoenix dactylifera]|uniref:Zinc finger MYND domain-containing protein 15 n=1 Tax=Phoenix dactylifera TaxID=42345 RepID=A0A8B7MUF1_PHODC|nr:zinc finger MYND domain-containing protein 15 [Phoenix dactylifera]